MQTQDKIESFDLINKKRVDLSNLLLKKDLFISKHNDGTTDYRINDEREWKQNISKHINQTNINLNVSESLCELPKIPKIQNRTFLNSSIMINMDGIKINKNSFKSKLTPKNQLNNGSLINIIKSAQLLLNKTNQQTLKSFQKKSAKTQNKPFYKRVPKKLNILPKEQRYFEMKPVVISSQRIKQLGYYQATNIYKPSNIKIQLDKQCLVTQQYHNNQFKVLSKNDIFLTNLRKEDLVFKIDEFIDYELNKQIQYQKVISKNQSKHQQISFEEQIKEQYSNIENKKEETLVEQNQRYLGNIVYITIADYEFVKNNEFKFFKINNLANWGEVLCNFQRICKCLKTHKISFFKVKSENLLKWCGKKYLLSEINSNLGLQCIERPEQTVNRCCLSFIDRTKVRKMKDLCKKKQSLARWVCQRIRIRTRIRKLVRQKLQRALQLHKKLLKSMQWDIQIHICSFSIDNNKRSTSQFIDSFQNIYHELWNNNSKQIILIIPTLNQNILKLLQNKIRIKKNITIICPEVYQIFPINMCLTAQVLFSYETLQKLTNVIKHKKAIIIPGHYQNNKYELLLSQHLNAPLLCSLEIKNHHSHQKLFFDSAMISNPKYCVIEPKSTYPHFLEIFTNLLLQNNSQKRWIFKLNNQFNGRGIATLQINPSKYFKPQNTPQQNKMMIYDHLLSFLKLKIKISYQNSLYTVDSYLKQFLLNGGIIEQDIKTDFVYQISMKKYRNCEFRFLYKVYGSNYSNKVWLSCQPNRQLLIYINNIQQALDKQQYYGFISVSLSKNNENRYFGIEVKLYPTYSSSMVSFIKMVQQKRISTENVALNISNMKTIRPQTLEQEQNLNLSLCFNNYKYLLIPNLILTDIQEELKAKIIQDIMQKCWTDKHIKIHQECRVYMSLGLDLSLILIGKDLKKLKKQGIDCMRELNDLISGNRKYRGKQAVRDVFQFGDVIRAINKLKYDQ